MAETVATLKHKLKRVLDLKRSLDLVWRSGPKWTIANVPLLLSQGIFELLGLYLMKLMIESVTTGLASPDKTEAFDRVIWIVAFAAAVSLAAVIFRLLTEFVNEALGQALTDHVHNVLHAKSVAVDLEYYENSRYFDTLHNAQKEAPFRPKRIVNSVVGIFQKSILLAVIAGLLISLDWRISVVLFVSLIPGVLVRLRYARELYQLQNRRTPAERQAKYLSGILTEDAHAKEIRLFNLGELFIDRYRQVRKQLREEKLAIATRRFFPEIAINVMTNMLVFGALAFIAFRALSGTVTVGDLVMYYLAFMRGQNYLQQLMSSIAYLYEDSLFLTNLYEFLDIKPKVVESIHPRPVPRVLKKGIVFEHVNFDYPNGDRKVLKDINLTIRPGEKIAIVGDNGSGKTTLVKLLCRLYDPMAGVIRFDGIDIREFETVKLRRAISVVFQDYVHYDLSARENIWLGNIDLPPNDERVLVAARNSGADAVIAGLPYGYETTLGKRFADGEELSIGEWQKVALARAFMRDAQIIVLDEPTSALDAGAEYEVFKKFYELTKGRMAIFISHRLSTVKMADRIYVLEGGRIVERGTHEELLRRRGKYESLFELQASSYR